jgi:WD40 repeat protein
MAEGSGANTKIVETSGWTEDTSFDPSMAFKEVYAWSYDGTKLAIGDDASNIIIFETSGWTAYSNTIAMSSKIMDLEFSPDDTLLACARRNTGSVHPVNVMTVATTMTSGSAFTAGMNIQDGASLAFNERGTLLYASCNGSDDGDIEAFNIPGGTSYATVLGADYLGGGEDISVSSGGGYVAVSTSANDAHVFNDKLELIATYSLALTGSAGGIAFENPR